jgi:hypothetical protein
VDYNAPYFAQLHTLRHYDYAGKKSVELTPKALGSYA